MYGSNLRTTPHSRFFPFFCDFLRQKEIKQKKGKKNPTEETALLLWVVAPATEVQFQGKCSLVVTFLRLWQDFLGQLLDRWEERAGCGQRIVRLFCAVGVCLWD